MACAGDKERTAGPGTAFRRFGVWVPFSGSIASKTVRFLAARLPYLADPVLWPYRMRGLFRHSHVVAGKETPELKEAAASNVSDF